MPWSYTVPPDLRPRLESVLGQRNFGAAEIWGEIRDWLVTHQVPMPETIEAERPSTDTAHHSQ